MSVVFLHKNDADGLLKVVDVIHHDGYVHVLLHHHQLSRQDRQFHQSTHLRADIYCRKNFVTESIRDYILQIDFVFDELAHVAYLVVPAFVLNVDEVFRLVQKFQPAQHLHNQNAVYVVQHQLTQIRVVEFVFDAQSLELIHFLSLRNFLDHFVNYLQSALIVTTLHHIDE